MKSYTIGVLGVSLLKVRRFDLNLRHFFDFGFSTHSQIQDVFP